MIVSQESIDEMYRKMEESGWNTEAPLKWGFFFFSSNKANLGSVYAELEDHEYNMESVQQNDSGDWVLSVSKTEILPSDKLYRRCLAFNQLAESCNSFFDGWDVGK